MDKEKKRQRKKEAMRKNIFLDHIRKKKSGQQNSLA